MNRHHDPDDEHDVEREWQAQERALRREREGVTEADADPRAAPYRALVQPLRQAPADELPADFAVRVAALAQRRKRSHGESPRGERWLQYALCAVLALALLGLPLWQPASMRAMQDSPLRVLWQSPWPWLLAACLAGSLLTQWLGGAWMQRRR